MAKQLIVISPPGERLSIAAGQIVSFPAPDDDYTHLIVENAATTGQPPAAPPPYIDPDDDDDAPVMSLVGGRPLGVTLAQIAQLETVSEPLTNQQVQRYLANLADGEQKVIVLGADGNSNG